MPGTLAGIFAVWAFVTTLGCIELYRRLRRSLSFRSVDSIPAADLYPTQEIQNPTYDGPAEEPRRNAALSAMRRALERIANYKIVPGST